MKKGNTVYEDAAEKETARKQKQQERLKKHIVKCVHCDKDVLDHMTKCPHCGKEITPQGYYQPMSDKRRKTVKIICYAVGIAIAIGIVLFVFLYKS